MKAKKSVIRMNVKVLDSAAISLMLDIINILLVNGFLKNMTRLKIIVYRNEKGNFCPLENRVPKISVAISMVYGQY